MKDRIAVREHTFPKHAKLMDEINNFSIAVKLHHTIKEGSEDAEKLQQARASVMKPTWENVSALLDKIIKELQQDRYNPIKY